MTVKALSGSQSLASTFFAKAWQVAVYDSLSLSHGIDHVPGHVPDGVVDHVRDPVSDPVSDHVYEVVFDHLQLNKVMVRQRVFSSR